MAFTLTGAQISELQTLRNSFPDVDDVSYSGGLNYYEMYELVLSYVEEWEEADEENVLTQQETVTKIWLEGVIGVNKGEGAQSDFIREYNSAQAELRFGSPISTADMDKASDQIALDVIDDILAIEALPGIDILAGEDVATVSTLLLNGNAAAWAGNPLLLFLGYADAFNNNILGSDNPTYDLLAALKVSYDTFGGFLGIYDPTNLPLLIGAGYTAIEADAEEVLEDAYDASDALLYSAYGLDLLDVSLSVLFGDIVLGSEGNDSAVGGSSLSFLGYSFNEIIHGGAGDDTLLGGYGIDILDGGTGTDAVSYAALEEAVAVNLAAGRSFVNGVAKDYLYNIERVIGSSYSDTFSGGSGTTTLEGGAGDDVFIANANAENLDGGDDADMVSYADSNAAVSVNLGTGAGSGGDAAGDSLSNIEHVAGSNYNDTLTGDSGGNILIGGEGADSIVGGSGDDILYDSVVSLGVFPGAKHSDTLDGGDGVDILVSRQAELDYLEAADMLTGGAGDDLLLSLGVEGGGGMSMQGGTGNDTFWIAGMPYVYVPDNKASLDGGDGDDTFWLNGLRADYTSSGGNDTLLAFSGSSVLGDNSTDLENVKVVLNPGLGASLVLDFQDIIDSTLWIGNTQVAGTFSKSPFLTPYDQWDLGGGWLADYDVSAGPSGDFFHVYNLTLGASVIIYNFEPGDFGISLADGSDSQPAFAMPTAFEYTPDFLEGFALVPVASMPHISAVNGTAADNVLLIGYGDHVATGGGGTDSFKLISNWYAHTLTINDFTLAEDADGNYETLDFLDFNTSPALILQQVGADTRIEVRSGANEYLSEIIYLTGIDATALTGDHFTNEGTVTVSTGVSGSASSDDDTLMGTAGNDTLSGLAGDDLIYGLGGDDLLSGDGDDDTLIGGDGNDTLSGGAGRDVLEGGAGIDLADYTGSDTWTIDLNAGTAHRAGDAGSIKEALISIEQIALGSGNDTVVGSLNADTVLAGAGNDSVSTGDGDDVVNAGDGNDAVNAGNGNDSLTGEAGADTLNGGAGADTISGGAGSNLLTGGAGVDAFIIGTDTVSASDTIADFDMAGGEVLDLTALGTGLALLLQDNPGNTTFTVGNRTVVLTGVEAGDLTTAHFYGVSSLQISIPGTGGPDNITGTEAADIIDALGGNDTVAGLGGNDSIAGGSGNDSLLGGDGDDTIAGDANNDVLAGGNGADSLLGGAGTDTLLGDAGADTLDGGDGNNTLTGGADTDRFVIATAGSSYTDTITDFALAEIIDLSALGTGLSLSISQASTNASFTVGTRTVTLQNFDGSALTTGNFVGVSSIAYAVVATSGADTLTGTSGADSIDGLGGNDIISGLGGADSLYGNGGDDTLIGGAGGDFLSGGTGSDTASYATSASGVTVSLLTGSVSGGDAAGDTFDSIESLIGSAYGDSLTGTSSHNTILGGEGNDTILGDSGNDVLDGDAGNDSLNGGAGADTLYGSDGADTMDGGASNDTLDYSRSTAAITINLTSGTYSGGYAAGDSVSNVEYFIATDYADSLTGNSSANSFIAGAGNDTVYGNNGNDTLIGGVGDDLLYGGSGNDDLSAVSGNNTMYGEAGDDELIGGSDADILSGGDDDDELVGGAGADSISGDAHDDTIEGGAGADTLAGGTGTDTLTYDNATGAVNVSLSAGTGSGAEAQGDVISGFEELIGSDYADTLTGSSGNDTIDGGNGANSIDGAAGADSLVGGSGNDTILGGEGNDTIKASSGDDSLEGGNGADSLDGSSGEDVLSGGAGADTLSGGSGNDTMLGGDGNDTLDGGSGVDRFTGGAGADRFYFATNNLGMGAEAEHITDFSQADGDKIEFSMSGISASGFVGTGGFAAGGVKEFGYTHVTDGSEIYTLIRIDYDNDGATDREIILDDVHVTLTSGDFLY